MISTSVGTGAMGTEDWDMFRLSEVSCLCAVRCSLRTHDPVSPVLRVRRRLLRAAPVVHLGCCP